MMSAMRMHQLKQPSGTRLSRKQCRVRAVQTVEKGVAAASSEGAADPLILRALRGEKTERSPVWAMRQAGRCMKIYRDMCKRPGATTFRERSENVDLIVEVSLQPYKAFKPDGVILFSDILTPLTGMSVDFDILPGVGPQILDTVTCMADVEKITPLCPQESVPYAGEALTALRGEVGNSAAVLGFVGAPWTLATYLVEGGMTSSYKKIKAMAFSEPAILQALLQRLAESLVTYVRYQADSGAQVVQIFDSWAGELAPSDFEVFSLPYLKYIIAEVKSTHPDLPLIIYASGSAGLLERMATAGADVVSLDGGVDMADARARLGAAQGVQGNLDPTALFGSKETIEAKVLDTLTKARAVDNRHIMNLGTGVMVGTPEDNLAHYFEVARTAHERGVA